MNVTRRFSAALSTSVPGSAGSSMPALRTASRSGAIPRSRSMNRTTSARAAPRARFDVSLPAESVWPTTNTRAEKPRPLATSISSRNSAATASSTASWPCAGRGAFESNVMTCA